MKMKIVVKVSMDDEKSRTKALKISVCISGVESAALKGDAVEVIGEGIDPVELTRQLRKSMSRADLISVGELKKEDGTAKVAKVVAPEPLPPVIWTYPPFHQPAYYTDGFPNYHNYSANDAGCTIM